MNSDGTWTIQFSRNAIKFLAKQDAQLKSRVKKALEGLLQVPPTGDILKMKGYTQLYRLRVGSIRIVYTPNFTDRVIQIEAIDNRGDIY